MTSSPGANVAAGTAAHDPERVDHQHTNVERMNPERVEAEVERVLGTAVEEPSLEAEAGHLDELHRFLVSALDGVERR